MCDRWYCSRSAAELTLPVSLAWSRVVVDRADEDTIRRCCEQRDGPYARIAAGQDGGKCDPFLLKAVDSICGSCSSCVSPRAVMKLATQYRPAAILPTRYALIASAVRPLMDRIRASTRWRQPAGRRDERHDVGYQRPGPRCPVRNRRLWNTRSSAAAPRVQRSADLLL